ncbi:MAG: hypothetical protein IJK52_11245 [Oscillospiraceae bacterium]|nr:hypothetical protein [Oscillospiraceae bacterium]
MNAGNAPRLSETETPPMEKSRLSDTVDRKKGGLIPRAGSDTQGRVVKKMLRSSCVSPENAL